MGKLEEQGTMDNGFCYLLFDPTNVKNAKKWEKIVFTENYAH